jgi:uncharacterized protein YcfJ
MQLQGYWHQFMADAGNKPGAQQGDVTVTMIKPIGGIDEITVPSAGVILAAEVGQLIGVQLITPGGRHLFIAAGNLAGIVDAPLESDEKSGKDDDDDKSGHRSGRAGGRSPVVVSGT